jgi:DNA-binding MarR family transcriptional regulator
MKLKKENTEGFAMAMVNLGLAYKNEAEYCAKLCGGVSEKELMVIGFVGQYKTVKMSDIAETIVAPMSTLTSIVDKLVDKKLIARDHSGEDRRVINVSLTPAGKTAYNKITGIKNKIATSVLSQLNEKEQVLISTYLNLLANELKSTK